MKKFKQSFLSSDFIKFLIVNGFAAVANFSSRILFSLWVSYSTSIILAYLIGMTTAYILCRLFVFQTSKNKMHIQILYFIAINGLAILQTLAVSVYLNNHLLFIKHAFTREEVAHLIGICVPAFTSYLGHKYITFRK